MNSKRFIKITARICIIILAALLGWFLYKPNQYNIICPRCEHNVTLDVRTVHNTCQYCGFLFPMKKYKDILSLDTVEYLSYTKHYDSTGR